MTSEPQADSRLDASSQRASRAGSWIVFLFQPKIAIPVIVMLMVVAGPLIFRAFRLSLVPPAGEPFDTAAVLAFTLPDTDNAFIEYREASSVLVPRDPKVSMGEFDKAQSDGWQHATEPVQKWLDANRPFMELWQKGTAKSDAQYFPAKEYSAMILIPVIQEAREFGRLVRLEASRLLAEGRAEEAWNWLRTGFRMSRQLGRHGVMMERLVGIATHASSAEGMVQWANDSRVNADLLRRAMTELQVEQKRRPPLSACLQLEYLSVMASWQSLIGDNTQLALFRVTGDSEITERAFRHLFANWLSQADLPRQQRTKTLPGLFVFETTPSIAKSQPSASELSGYVHKSVMAAMLVPSIQQVFIATDREVARDRVLLTVLALELFARKHGQSPEKLEELVPDFLPTVPEDSHAPAKTPLRYRRDADDALIYSVGENGTDDGGLIEKTEDIGYRIGKRRENKP